MGGAMVRTRRGNIAGLRSASMRKMVVEKETEVEGSKRDEQREVRNVCLVEDI